MGELSCFEALEIVVAIVFHVQSRLIQAMVLLILWLEFIYVRLELIHVSKAWYMQLRSSLCFVVHWSKWCSTFEEISTIPSFISKYLALWYQTLQPGKTLPFLGNIHKQWVVWVVLRLLSSVYIHSIIAGSFDDSLVAQRGLLQHASCCLDVTSRSICALTENPIYWLGLTGGIFKDLASFWQQIAQCCTWQVPMQRLALASPWFLWFSRKFCSSRLIVLNVSKVLNSCSLYMQMCWG